MISTARWVVLCLALAGCGRGAEGAAADGGPPPAVVEVAAARSGSLVDTWSVLGNVHALERAQLAAGAAGPVARVFAREGDAVRKDALLLEVQTDLASARLASAKAAASANEAELKHARAELARMEKVDASVLSTSELERARADVATRQAQQDGLDAAAREAFVALDRHRVRAPFDGTVSSRLVHPGDWVSPGQAVLGLISTGAVEVHVHAPADLGQQVQVGDGVLVQGTPAIAAHVVGLVPALDPVERTVLVRVQPDEPAPSLLPGAPVDVSFPVQRRSDGAVLIPRDALILGPVSNKVALAVDGSAEIVSVQVLATTDAAVLVKGEGLVEGAMVVVRGNERLRPGQALNATERGWTQD